MKSQKKVFNEIIASVPKEWKEQSYILKAPETPRKILELALADPDISASKKRIYRAILDSGQLDAKISEPNVPILKKMQAMIRRKTNLAIKKGLLNPRIKKLIK